MKELKLKQDDNCVCVWCVWVCVCGEGCLCWAVCGILVSRPGIELCPLQWKRGILTTGPPGDSLKIMLSYERYIKNFHLCETLNKMTLKAVGDARWW